MKICSFHLDYTGTKGVNTATIGCFFFAKHLMPSHSMRCQMSFLAVGFAAPSGGSAKKRRASLGQPVEETAKHWHEATIQNTSKNGLGCDLYQHWWWHKRDISSKAARTWQFCGKQTIFSMFWVYHRWGGKEGNSQPISHTIKKCERVCERATNCITHCKKHEQSEAQGFIGNLG